MKKAINRCTFFLFVNLLAFTSFVLSSAWAGPDPKPITADQAFEAVMTGIDPITGAEYGEGKVIIVDVRTPAEFQFQGTAGKVDSILFSGAPSPLVPDLGKVRFTDGGEVLEFRVAGKTVRAGTEKVVELITSPIAVNIPCATWNQETKEMDPAVDLFPSGIETLAEDGVKVVITMCNSGGRSTACVAKFVSDELASKFAAFYEIDRAGKPYLNPDKKLHLAGLGGFQGSAYNGVYNGYSGFPGRLTVKQTEQGWAQGKPNGQSVSWKDSGLPIFIPETSCNLSEMPRTP